MRAIPVSSESHRGFLFPLPPPSFSSNSIPISHSSLFFFHPFHFRPLHSLSTPKPCSSKCTPFLCTAASEPDPITLGDVGVEESEESLVEDGVCIEVMKLDKNSRRIESRISIEASLSSIWNILTDYERLADFIPGLAVSQLLQKGDNYARLLQIGQQNIAFGIKFNAKGIVDCYEKELETLPTGIKREIEFKMIEGDFQLFEGKWSILQIDVVKFYMHHSWLTFLGEKPEVEGDIIFWKLKHFNSENCEQSQVREVSTTLSYVVDVKPKLWLPIRLIEGRLCNEIKMNLVSVRNEAQKESVM